MKTYILKVSWGWPETLTNSILIYRDNITGWETIDLGVPRCWLIDSKGRSIFWVRGQIRSRDFRILPHTVTWYNLELVSRLDKILLCMNIISQMDSESSEDHPDM